MDDSETLDSSSHTIPHQHRSSLEQLPTEILSQIVSNLQTTPALRLYRCSKTLTSHISLNQAFWRDQLATGDLVEYLWDLDPNECSLKDSNDSDRAGTCWDWKSLARTLVSAQIFEGTLADLEGGPVELHSRNPSLSLTLPDVTMPDAPLGLKNRCRIVRIIRDIERLDEIEAEDPTIVEDGQLVVPHRLSLASWKEDRSKLGNQAELCMQDLGS